MRSMAIVDMKFYKGELFVSGISNQEFCSALRRIPFPFTGVASETHIENYHAAHARYESRAPIRAMQFATLHGEDTLSAIFSPSPVLMFPMASLEAAGK